MSTFSHQLTKRRSVISAGAALFGTRVFGSKIGRAATDTTYHDIVDSVFAEAFGAASDWDPVDGFRANRENLVACYDYYQVLYLRNPDRFLWAGLARLAGASVMRGLEAMVRGLGLGARGQPDPSDLTVAMVTLVRDVFATFAWQHDVIVRVPGSASGLLAQFDRDSPATNSYRDLWNLIATADDLDGIVNGNLLLMTNEQFDLVQPVFGAIGRVDPIVATGLSLYASEVHPYHRAFLDVVPGGTITDADQRWAWITALDGLWPTWIQLPQEERTRLVLLDVGALADQQWGPTLSEYLLGR